MLRVVLCSCGIVGRVLLTLWTMGKAVKVRAMDFLHVNNRMINIITILTTTELRHNLKSKLYKHALR